MNSKVSYQNPIETNTHLCLQTNASHAHITWRYVDGNLIIDASLCLLYSMIKGIDAADFLWREKVDSLGVIQQQVFMRAFSKVISVAYVVAKHAKHGLYMLLFRKYEAWQEAVSDKEISINPYDNETMYGTLNCHLLMMIVSSNGLEHANYVFDCWNFLQFNF